MTTTTTIPAGYRLTVTTWENDADNYKTEVLEGLSKEDVKFYTALCKLLAVSTNYDDRICNLYEPSDDELARVDAAARWLFSYFPGVLQSHFGIEPTDDLFGPEDELSEMALDCFTEAASTLGATSGDFYLRVVSEWKVEFIPMPIELVDVTAEFV